MNESRRARQDLRYVRETLVRSEQRAVPSSILFLWAAIIAVGFPLQDLRPLWVPLYWSVAGPAGFLLSLGLGWWGAHRTGQRSLLDARRHSMHWGALLCGCFLLVPVHLAGELSHTGLSHAILGLVGLAYLLAGVHLARGLVLPGAVALLANPVVAFLDAWRWTVMGGVLALALAVSALVGGARSSSRSD